MRVSIVSVIITLTSIQMLLAFSVKGQSISIEKVRFNAGHESFEAVIKQIEQQTAFRFYYRRADIKKLINLNMPAGSQTVEQTLQELLHNTFLSFRQIDNSILIEKATQQTSYEIKGRVIGLNREAIDYATVLIKKMNSNRPVRSTITDTSGHFKLQVNEKGNYLVSISAVGMDSLSVSISLADQQVIQLPDVVLSAKTNTLKAVTVIGKKAFIEQRIDRTIVNVGALISNDGANALEVLEKSPGVQVDENGTITFKGKKGVMVLIDGKPTYLSGDNLANYLKSMQASSLDQIELMSNPPAKYEASGNAGLINIKTKKATAQGFNGNFSASVGKAAYFRSNENLNLNYHQGKVNLFATVGYNLQNNYRRLNTQRNYFDINGNLNSVYKQEVIFKPITSNPNLKLGMNYEATSATTLGFVLTGSLSSGKNHNTSSSTISDNKGALDSNILADNNTKSKFNTGGINLNYSHRFDNHGKELSFDLDYVKYSSNKDQIFDNNTYDAKGNFADNLTITDNLPTYINIYAAKTDYVQTLNSKAKIEAGLKSSYVNTDNAANYFNVIGGIPEIDYNTTNRFLYKENTNAAYISWSRDFKRISVKTGLRAENTNVNGHQLGNAKNSDSSFVQHYANLFPTAYFSYKIDVAGNHLMNFSYGRRIDRPFYQDLNPFLTFIDKYGYWAGNPYLKPQLSSNYELSYHYKNSFSFAIQYNYISNYQVETVQKSGAIFISRTLNLGENPYYGVNADATLDPVKWWNVHLYVELTNNITKGSLYNTYLNTGQIYFFTTTQNQFEIGNGWSAELSGFYITPKIDGQYTHIATGQLNIGIQKKILNNKGSVRLGARDILRTNFSGGNILGIPEATSTWHNDFANRMVTVGFSYNFGKSLNGTRKRNTGSAESEKGRVKN